MSVIISNPVLEETLKKHKSTFKHLRVLSNIIGLSGRCVVEVETKNGMYISQIVPTSNNYTEVDSILNQWTPKNNQSKAKVHKIK